MSIKIKGLLEEMERLEKYELTESSTYKEVIHQLAIEFSILDRE